MYDANDKMFKLNYKWKYYVSCSFRRMIESYGFYYVLFFSKNDTRIKAR